MSSAAGTMSLSSWLMGVVMFGSVAVFGGVVRGVSMSGGVVRGGVRGVVTCPALQERCLSAAY